MSLIFQTFMSNFKDVLNTPSQDLAAQSEPDGKWNEPCGSETYSSIFQVTLFDLRLNSLSIVLDAGDAALQFLLPYELVTRFNNVPGQLYNKVLEVALPLAELRVLHCIGKTQRAWLEVARFLLDVECERIGVQRDREARSLEQKAFVYDQDLSTLRAESAFRHAIGQDEGLGE
jgi:hypothetical protein